jgi:predicted esterase
MINRIQGPSAGFYYPDHHALDREISATVEALRREYSDRIDGPTMVYAGYSQGATMGALILPDRADLFPRAVLVEGGVSEWSAASAKKYAKSGGERLLFVCGVKTCKHGADRSAHLLRRADLEVETKLAVGAGHTYLGAVAKEIAEGFAWLVAGDARFAAR